MAGSAGIVVAEPLLRVSFALGKAVLGVVGPMQALGLILVGIAIIRGGVWGSWRRYTVLGLGLYVPCLMVPLWSRRAAPIWRRWPVTTSAFS